MAKQSKPEDAETISHMDDAEVAELLDRKGGDLTVTGRDQTEVRAETKVIDRTESAERILRPTKSVEMELSGGTIERRYVDADEAE